MEVRQARREFFRTLQVERRRTFQEAGTSIESIMESGKVREAGERTSWWYQQVSGQKTPSTKEALDEVSKERAELYMWRPPEGLRVPLLVRKSDIEYGISTEA